MLVAIDNVGIDLSEEEKAYMLKLKEAFPNDNFAELFTVDSEYQITSVIPPHDKPTSMILIFFFLNVMMNQRMRKFEKIIMKIPELETEINDLKNKLQGGPT